MPEVAPIAIAPAGFGAVKLAALQRAVPLSAHLELTYACNWRCVFCYNPRHFDRRGLTLEEWLAVIDDLRGLGTLTVTLTGGEPLRHPRFFEIAAGVRAQALALKVYTNGALIDAEAAARLAELRPLAVELSLHGATAVVHDAATATPGSFDALWRGVDALRAHGARLLLKTPLTRLNEHELDALIARVAAEGLPHTIDPTLTPNDDGSRAPLGYTASPAGVARLMTALRAAGRLPQVERQPGGVNCGLGRLTLAVDPEGDVFPCLQWRRRPLGNVRRVPLREIWRTSDERAAAADVARSANDALLARGGPESRFPFCPALALDATGDPLQPDAAFVARARAAHAARENLERP
jgi:MoaA/NifB/PqqE/SkfB family radical SAM enzyme